VALLENHVAKSAPQMFTAAAGEIVKQMKSMREGMGATLD